MADITNEIIKDSEQLTLNFDQFLNKDAVIIHNDYFQKSNFLISAKYKSTLLENKIIMLGMANIKKNEEGRLISEMKADYIRSMIQKGKKNGSFYDQLLAASINMTSRSFVIQDQDGFDVFTMTPRAKYIKGAGIFRIYWENDLEPYLYGLKTNYTQLSINMFMQFKSVYSFRLYELLKSRMYIPRYSQERVMPDSCFKVTFGLAELKLNMGVVDAGDSNVRKYLVTRGKSQTKPDYEKAVEAAKEKTYEKWQKFKTSVLEKGIQEINEKSDIEVQYEVMKCGHGGKVVSVIFYVRKKQSQEKVKKECRSQDEVADFIDEMADFIEERLKYKDMIRIAETADYDMEKIRNAYAVATTSSKTKENLTGYLIAAIRNNYSLPVRKEPAVRKKNKAHERVDDIDIDKQDKYWDLLEQSILFDGCGADEQKQLVDKKIEDLLKN